MNIDFKLRANAKLLISGEYLVMNGAKALAFPLCFGQEMCVNLFPEPLLKWKSKQLDDIWFTASFNLYNFEVISTSDDRIANELSCMLQFARNLNEEFLLTRNGYTVEVNADYPLEWGLGSSSTLISMLARWANVNEYALFRMISAGSGYDLACATQQQPVFYQLVNNMPVITTAEVGNGIKKHCLFAYLGNKQNTNHEIEQYNKSANPASEVIHRISELSDNFCKASDSYEITAVMDEHEAVMSSVLNKTAIAMQRFPAFNGSVKSLGAWGGDFAMFAGHQPIEAMREEIKQFGITTIFSYDELLIKNS
ncbi:MAG: GYDIA family GHMP kinase [Bacteroidetes bacterium]|nr:GYDIA family GHMP kinase [Bacteroidota bacterium]